MSYYTLSTSIALGTSKTGLVLAAQLFDTNGTDVGTLLTEKFVEIGQGNYLWTYSYFPAGFRGGVKFYNQADLTKVLAASAINPEEAETVKNLETTVNSPRQISVTAPTISSGNLTITQANSSGTYSGMNLKTGVR